MKKYVLMAACLLLSVSVFAAKPLKVENGSISVLKEDAVATWSIDFTGATFEGKQSFEEWSGEEYNGRIQSMNDTFFESFNKYSKGLKLTKEGSAGYNLAFKVDNFVRKQGPGMWGSCFIQVYGTIVITDKASGETVCEIAVNGVKGDTDFVENDRFPKTMDWLCRDLFKLK